MKQAEASESLRPAHNGGHLSAIDVTVSRRGRRLLQPMSFDIRPGALVAVIGASGAGKTTLLEVLAGQLMPSSGAVGYGGAESSTFPKQLHTMFGYVPQDDIIHIDLPLVRTLRYSARLRMPWHTDAEEIDRAVDCVLDELGLSHVAHTPVCRLSGGERKRASMAAELLSHPPILFLDEPTSGLDPANAAELMRLLADLAGVHSTIVLTTHNPSDIAYCSTLVVLAPAGNLAYIGPPSDALEYFQVDTAEQIYHRLATVEDPSIWAERWRSHRTAAAPEHSPKARQVPTRESGPGPIGQLLLLSRRNVDLLISNRLSIAILLGSPAAILLMFVMLFPAGAFEPSNVSPNTTVMILFWIAFGTFFFGLTYGLPQICDEFAIIRREHMAGLRIGSYVGSKVATILPLLAVVDVVLLAVLRGTRRLPAADLHTVVVLSITAVLTSAAALALGLLVSAAVKHPAQAVLMLPLLCFPQVLFVGAFLPVPAMAVVGRWLSYAMSNRWSFEALGHSTGVEPLWRDGGSPLGPPLLAAYQDTFARPIWLDWTILLGFTLAALAGTIFLVTMKARPSRSRTLPFRSGITT